MKPLNALNLFLIVQFTTFTNISLKILLTNTEPQNTNTSSSSAGRQWWSLSSPWEARRPKVSQWSLAWHFAHNSSWDFLPIKHFCRGLHIYVVPFHCRSPQDPALPAVIAMKNVTIVHRTFRCTKKNVEPCPYAYVRGPAASVTTDFLLRSPSLHYNASFQRCQRPI